MAGHTPWREIKHKRAHVDRLRAADPLGFVRASSAELTVVRRPDDADEALDEFVAREGGRLIKVRPPQSQRRRPGRLMAPPPSASVAAYEVPKRLLEPPTDT